MNVYDSSRMEHLLAPLGYETTDVIEEANLAILNTCHIREKAEQKVYSDLGRLNIVKREKKKNGSDLTIAVAGCVAQAEGREIMRQAPYVSMVFGPQNYHQLPEMIAQLKREQDKGKKKGRGIVSTSFPVEDKFDYLPVPEKSPSSAFLSIQEGCDKFCKFCVVPYTRGAEYSRPVQKVLDEAKKLVDGGAKEITLLGQNVTAYHGVHKGATWSIAKIIEALANFSALYRIRYTTSHPRDTLDELIAAHADIPKLMPYLHLPVQSGSDHILKEMNRKHTAEDYFILIERFKKAQPLMAFSSDFIVGFPGESEKDFEKTLELVEKVGFAQAYSFMYSERPGTPAALMELQVQHDEKSKRLQHLQNLLGFQQLRFNQSKIGTIQEVLFERHGNKPGQLLGKSVYMQSVIIDAPDRLLGQILPVEITHATTSSLKGEVVTYA